MKKILKILALLIVTGVLAIGGLILYLNPILEHFKPEIEKVIAKGINHHLSIGKISLNPFPETIVEVSELRLSKDENSKAELGKLLLKTNLSTLFEKKLNITDISLVEPNLNITKKSDGSLSINGLDLSANKQETDKTSKDASKKATSEKSEDNSQTDSALVLNVNKVNLKNANIIFIDQTKNPEQKISLNKINLLLNNVSTENIEDLQFTASFLDNRQNINLNGQVQNYKSPFAFDLNLNLDSLSLAKLKEIMPNLSDYNLGGDLKINLIAKKSREQEFTDFSRKLELSLSNFETSMNKDGKAINLKDLNIKFILDNKLFSIPAFGIFNGTLMLNGEYSPQKLSSKINLENIDLAQAMSGLGLKNSFDINGKLTKLDLNIQGNPAEFATDNSGNITALLDSGEILGFNILGDTLKELFKLPLLGMAASSVIPQEYLPIIQKNSTAFDEIKMAASFSGKNINLSSLLLKHALYNLDAEGKIAANGNINLNAKLILSEMFMGKLILREPKLKLLADKNNNIIIPVVIRKEGNSFIVLPDLADLGKRALNSAAKDVATKAVGKAIDKVAPGLGSTLDSLF